VITRIRGTALVPGISKNNRYYSPGAIRAAVTQAQPRIQAGQLLMRSHHEAADTLGYVGRVTALRVGGDGRAEFEGELADTTTARDLRRLISGTKPFINSVSIAGEWVGKMQTVNVEGQEITTAPGLLLHSVDFTARPGVDQARFRVAESLTGKRYIYEEAGPVEPVPAELDASDYAAMPYEDFRNAAGSYFAQAFADMDQRRRDEGPSPFWRQAKTI